MTDTEKAEKSALNDTQRARAEALSVARRSLGKTTGGLVSGGNLGEFTVLDLIDVARYVIDGTHPLTGFTSSDDADVVTFTGDAITPGEWTPQADPTHHSPGR